MIKYLIRVGKHSASLVRAEHLERVAQYDDPEDQMVIVKEFEAICWCAAQQVFARHQGHDPYDMRDCNNQKKARKVLCQYYGQQRVWMEKLKKVADEATTEELETR